MNFLGHQFWQPVSALRRFGSGWILERDGRVVGAIVHAGPDRFEVYLKRDGLAVSAGSASTLPAAAERLWGDGRAGRWPHYL